MNLHRQSLLAVEEERIPPAFHHHTTLVAAVVVASDYLHTLVPHIVAVQDVASLVVAVAVVAAVVDRTSWWVALSPEEVLVGERTTES